MFVIMLQADVFPMTLYCSIWTDVHWLLTTGLYACAMVSLRNVLYHMYFRCFARRCSTNV